MPTAKKCIELPEHSTSFTKDFIGLKVRDKDDVAIGSLADMAIKMGVQFPDVSSIVVAVQVRVSLFGRARFEAVIPWRMVAFCDGDVMRLSVDYSGIKPGKLGKDELLLKKHVMDQQIVDNEGKRLLRVNDVKLRPVTGHIRLVGVETGIKGLLYRLGAGRRLEAVAKLLNVTIMENIIMWELVEQFDNEMRRIKLAISQQMLKDLINL